MCYVCVCVCGCCQVIIQSGQPPTVLQQLCSLPFPYFSDARLINILFPTLVSCCFLVDRNREILQQELSCALLANFIEVGFITKPITFPQGSMSYVIFSITDIFTDFCLCSGGFHTKICNMY